MIEDWKTSIEILNHTLLTRGCRARNWCAYINDADRTYRDPRLDPWDPNPLLQVSMRGEVREKICRVWTLFWRVSLSISLSFSRHVKRWPSPRGDKPTGCVGSTIIIVIIFLSCLQHVLTFIGSCHSVFIRSAVEIARISDILLG